MQLSQFNFPLGTEVCVLNRNDGGRLHDTLGRGQNKTKPPNTHTKTQPKQNKKKPQKTSTTFVSR